MPCAGEASVGSNASKIKTKMRYVIYFLCTVAMAGECIAGVGTNNLLPGTPELDGLIVDKFS